MRKHYADFGPLLAHEYLQRDHGYSFSVETLRGWMIQAELWSPTRRRAQRVPLALLQRSPWQFTKADPEDARPTQFERAFLQLHIESICAHSPQAKGVWSGCSDVQDRLCKAMWLQRIDTVEEANHFIGAYLDEHNERFAVSARGAEDLHRPWRGLRTGWPTSARCITNASSALRGHASSRPHPAVAATRPDLLRPRRARWSTSLSMATVRCT